MSEYTWRDIERADMDTAAAHSAEMEYRAEQIAREAQKRLARMEHIVDGLGEVKGEIVRCKDCRHGVTFKTLEGMEETNCNYWGQRTEPDGFCAWGERRTE